MNKFQKLAIENLEIKKENIIRLIEFIDNQDEAIEILLGIEDKFKFKEEFEGKKFKSFNPLYGRVHYTKECNDKRFFKTEEDVDKFKNGTLPDYSYSKSENYPFEGNRINIESSWDHLRNEWIEKTNINTKDE